MKKKIGIIWFLISFLIILVSGVYFLYAKQCCTNFNLFLHSWPENALTNYFWALELKCSYHFSQQIFFRNPYWYAFFMIHIGMILQDGWDRQSLNHEFALHLIALDFQPINSINLYWSQQIIPAQPTWVFGLSIWSRPTD